MAQQIAEQAVKEIPDLIRILAALLAPITAFLTIKIGREQCRIHKRQLKLQLFDKRIAIYEKIAAYIAHILQEGNVDNKEMFALLRETRNAKFVFDKETDEYVKELYKKSNQFKTLNTVLATLKTQEEKDINIKKQGELFDNYFKKELEDLPQRFEKYLKLEG